MWQRALWAFGLLSGMLTVGPALAQEWLPAGQDARFQKLAEEHQARKLLAWKNVQNSPSRFEGKVVFLEGTLRGQVRSARGTTLMFDLDDGGQLEIRLEPTDPPVSVGSYLRLLVQVGAGGTPELLAAIYGTGKGTVPDDGTAGTGREGPASTADSSNRPESGTTVGDRLTQTMRREASASRAGSPRSGAPNRSAPPSRGNIPGMSRGARIDEKVQAIQVIRSFNRQLGDATVEQIASRLVYWSGVYGLRWQFLAALVAAESRFDPRATSSKGAMGLGQLMPGTAASLGVAEPYDIDQNLQGSARYLRAQLDRYRKHDPAEQIQLALAAYNAGPGTVSRYGGVPPYSETRNYIRRVATYYASVCEQTGVSF